MPETKWPLPEVPKIHKPEWVTALDAVKGKLPIHRYICYAIKAARDEFQISEEAAYELQGIIQVALEGSPTLGFWLGDHHDMWCLPCSEMLEVRLAWINYMQERFK